jgi:hypothetical protein
MTLERPAFSPSREADAMPGTGEVTVEVDRLSPDVWNRLIGEFVDASYEQTACLLDDRWGANRVSHLVVRRKDVVIGGARLLLLKPPVLRGGLAQAKFAPFWRRHDRPADPAAYRSVVTALIEEYCVHRGCYLSIIPRPHPTYYAVEIAILSELGFMVRHASADENRYFVDLSLGGDALMRSLDQKWRYKLRQALANDIEIRFGHEEACVAAFSCMHTAMLARKRLHSDDAVHLLPEFSAQLPAMMRPRTVLALHGGIPVAGAVIAICGDVAVYLFGASTDRALPLKAGFALQWSAVRRLAEQGVRWYDLGGGNRDPGLRQFKKGLVGRAGTVLPLCGEFARWRGLGGRIVADALHLARNAQLAARALRN